MRTFATEHVLVAILLACALTPAAAVKIGVVVAGNDDPRLANPELWRSGGATDQPLVERIGWWGTIDLARAVCNVAKKGAKAVVAPGLATIWLEPVFESYARALGLVPLSQRNLLPDTARATAALITHYAWDSFTYIYDSDCGPHHLSDVLSHLNSTPVVDAFYRVSDRAEARRLLLQIPVGRARVLMATSERIGGDPIHLAQGRSDLEGIAMTPVAIVQRTSEIRRDYKRWTKFSLVDKNSSSFKEFENMWKSLPLNRRPSANTKEIPDSAVVSADTGRILSALDLEDSPVPVAADFDCFDYSTKGQPPPLTDMDEISGLTGTIRFGEKRERVGYSLDVIEVNPVSWKKIAKWSEDSGLELEAGVKPALPTPSPQRRLPPVRVVSISNRPYLFEGPTGKLEGFVADMVNRISAILDRRFDIHLVKDGAYGMQDVNGNWIGMIGEVVRDEADVVIADLTKTMKRAKIVDFSYSFLTFGLNMLVHKPEVVEDPESEIILGPWGLLMAALFLAAPFSAAVSYTISRFLGAPDRVRALEAKSTDNLSPCGSFWFVAGALLQQDTGIYPRTFAHRLWTVVWWIFCFLVLAGYVSNLTEGLIEKRSAISSVRTIKTSQEVLQDLLENGSPDIGAVGTGSTQAFFKNSAIGAYRDLGDYLIRRRDVWARSSADGAERVRREKGRYAFLMESPSSEYFASLPPCDTMSTSGFLTTKSYAMAVKKGSEFRLELDYALLALMEKGELKDLYDKWWHNNTHGCEDKNLDMLQTIYQSSLTLHEMSGVFYMFIGGIILSIAVGVLEFFFIKRRTMSSDL